MEGGRENGGVCKVGPSDRGHLTDTPSFSLIFSPQYILLPDILLPFPLSTMRAGIYPVSVLPCIPREWSSLVQNELNE